MMKVLWHPIPFVCPKCHKDVKCSLFLTRKGQMKAIAECCNETIIARFSVADVMTTCTELDVLLPYENQLKGDQ